MMNRLLLAALLIVPSLALAGTVAPIKPSDILTVYASPGTTTNCPFDAEFVTQVGIDGQSAPFSVPPGFVFVVTDVELAIFAGTGAPGHADGFVPFKSTANVSYGAVYFTYDALGAGFVRQQIMPTPVRGPICQGFSATHGYSVLHGFVAKDK
jgi:hypothetical protein